MFPVTEAKKVVKLLASMNDEMYFNIQRQRVSALSESIDRKPDCRTRDEAVAFVVSEVGIVMPADLFELIMELFPEVRIELAVSGVDTVARGLLLDALATLFLGCRWPIIGDGLSDEESETFVNGLREQAHQLGYEVVDGA